MALGEGGAVLVPPELDQKSFVKLKIAPNSFSDPFGIRI